MSLLWHKVYHKKDWKLENPNTSSSTKLLHISSNINRGHRLFSENPGNAVLHPSSNEVNRKFTYGTYGYRSKPKSNTLATLACFAKQYEYRPKKLNFNFHGFSLFLWLYRKYEKCYCAVLTLFTNEGGRGVLEGGKKVPYQFFLCNFTLAYKWRT